MRHCVIGMLSCVCLLYPMLGFADLFDLGDPDKGSTEKAGDVLRVIIPATGIGVAFAKDDDQGKRQFAKSFFTNLLITKGLKAGIDRERPNGACCDSFPSGHTSEAFQGAAFLQRRYGRKYGIPGYIGATYVAYSRVHADQHHLEDVVAGAAIGIGSSYIFTTPYKGFTVQPFADNALYGFNIARDWWYKGARFILWQSNNVLQVPASALFHYQGDWVVFTLEDGRARRRVVDIGHRNGLRAQIVGGVTESDIVIVHLDDKIEDDARVEYR